VFKKSLKNKPEKNPDKMLKSPEKHQKIIIITLKTPEKHQKKSSKLQTFSKNSC